MRRMDRESVATAKELAEKDRAIVREYYVENNFFTSAAGVLRVLSIVACAASSLLWLAGGGGAARWAGPASLAAAALLALLAAAALWLAACAPLLCFYTDIVSSTAISGWLLTAGALSLACCDPRRRLDRAHGPLAMMNACLVMSSAAITYVSVVRRWDAARAPLPPPPTPVELEV